MTLRITTPAASTWIERQFFTPPAPIKLQGEVANFLPGALLAGDMARIRLKAMPKAGP